MHLYRWTAGAIDVQVKQLRATGAAKVWLETARGRPGPASTTSWLPARSLPGHGRR
jgi:hypothetical protein